jgi:hypothetical protein
VAPEVKFISCCSGSFLQGLAWRHLVGLQEPEQVILPARGTAVPVTGGYVDVAERPALPPRHGMVVVPSATPKRDISYICSYTGEN